MLTQEQKNNVAAWLYNLEHGGYEQGMGYLIKESKDTPNVNEYCCLGVAAESVLDKAEYYDGSILLNKSDAVSFGLDQMLTDVDVQKLFRMGMHYNTAQDRQDVCVGMNDGAKKSFVEIAGVFRELEWDKC